MTKANKFSEYLEELTDPNRELSVAGLYRLSDLGREDLSALADVWPGIETERRRRVMALLNEISEASFEVDFQQVAQHLGLTDDDAVVRQAAVEALWEPEDVALMNAFMRLLSDDDDEVRAAAAQGLGRFVLLAELDKLPAQASVRLRDSLFAVVDEPSEPREVYRRALESLGFLSDKRLPDIIKHAYASADEQVRASAVFAMGRSADERWAGIVVDELDSESPEMRYEAARAAGEIEVRRAVPRLIQLTTDADREVLEAAIWSLGEIGGNAARRQLERLVEHEDEEIAEAADEALETLIMGQLGGEFGLLALDGREDEDEDELLAGEMLEEDSGADEEE